MAFLSALLRAAPAAASVATKYKQGKREGLLEQEEADATLARDMFAQYAKQRELANAEETQRRLEERDAAMAADRAERAATAQQLADLKAEVARQGSYRDRNTVGPGGTFDRGLAQDERNEQRRADTRIFIEGMPPRDGGGGGSKEPKAAAVKAMSALPTLRDAANNIAELVGDGTKFGISFRDAVTSRWTNSRDPKNQPGVVKQAAGNLLTSDPVAQYHFYLNKYRSLYVSEKAGAAITPFEDQLVSGKFDIQPGDPAWKKVEKVRALLDGVREFEIRARQATDQTPGPANPALASTAPQVDIEAAARQALQNRKRP